MDRRLDKDPKNFLERAGYMRRQAIPLWVTLE